MFRSNTLHVTADVIRWIARVASLLVLAQIVFVLLFFVGEGGLMGAALRKLLLFFLTYPGGVIVGMILAWWRPGLGGMVMLLSLAGWLLFGEELGGAAFPSGALTAIIAVLFVASSLLRQYALARLSAEHPVRIAFGRGLFKTLASVGLIYAVLLALAISAPLIWPIPSFREGWTNYTQEDGLAGDWIHVVAAGSDGAMWFGTDWGLSRFDGMTWTTYTPKGTSEGAFTTSIAAAPDGTMWFGTTRGVLRFDGKDWKSYTTADGLVDNEVWSIAWVPDGNLWVGTEGGTSRFDGKTWDTVTFPDGQVIGSVNAFAVTRNGDLWIGTGRGVLRFDGKEWTAYTTADGLAGNSICTTAVTPNGNLWVGSRVYGMEDGGLSRFDGKGWTAYTTINSPMTHTVCSIAVGPDGVVWVGTGGRVLRFDGKEWKTYTSARGQVTITSMAVGLDGALWVGTERGGVWRYSPSR